MAISAGVADVARIHGRSRIAGRQYGVLAVTVGADGRLRNALGQRLPVYAHAELAGHLVVAHPAGFRHRCPERRRPGPQQFMGGSMANGTIRRSPVTAPGGLAVHAPVIVRLLPLVALAAS